jgi:hypothetical protein
MERKKLLYLLAFISPPLFSQQPGDSLFSSSIVHEIRITFDQPDWWNTLTSNYAISNSQSTDIYIPAAVTIDTHLLDSVGVRLKGNASYSNPGMKKPLKLSFNEYIGSQRYDGLKSVHLNNSAFDPTGLREKLMLDVLNHHGLPAPRCTFAAVYMNGGYVGLYKIIESIDKKFLANRFGDNEGNLYKGDPNGTLEWKGTEQVAYINDYELKTNETENNWCGLIDLIDRINNKGSYFPSQIESRLDVDGYLWALAVNNVFANMDSYLYNPHNFYLYDDPLDGKFHWISWDVGLCFGVFPLWFQSRSESLDIFYLPNPPDRVPLNAHLFAYDRYKEKYLDAMCTLINDDFASWKIFPEIDSLANVIRPYIYAEPDSNRMYTNEQFEANVGYGSVNEWFASEIPGLKSFIAERNAAIKDQLCRKGWNCAGGVNAVQSSDQPIHVFPNPSNSLVTIFFESPDEQVMTRYRIYDLAGRLIFDENAIIEHGRYERILDFSNQPDGVYVMKVESKCDELEQKIIIIH